MERIAVGMLAPVDAGKTTLSEAVLFASGAVRRLGRVDHGDAFLDTHAIEKERGITVFSKQARFSISNREVTLIDTPGHIDFSPEAERTLGVLDCAILLVSAPDGVRTHTVTLRRLLRRRRVPTIVFINKTDLPSPTKGELMRAVREKLDSAAVDFTADPGLRDEDIATNDSSLTEAFLERGRLADSEIAASVSACRTVPVFFGAALKNQGVAELLDALSRFVEAPEYPAAFGARVYKIEYSAGQRLTHLKVTGGTLSAKQLITNRSASLPEADVWEEKADELRLYSGTRFTPVKTAEAGSIVAVTGLTRTRAGDGLGIDPGDRPAELTPVLSYSLIFPEDVSLFDAYRRLGELAEEEPSLGLYLDETRGEVNARLMGEVQCEVLARLIRERFGWEISFGPGAVMYRETVVRGAEGIGHFEPLRHYAHVELRIEPAERGSGLSFETEVPQNDLARSWQRLIMTHLAEKTHRGVLTGAPLTDVKITLTGGRAHLKHTEGGDFRQATYRAVRSALMFSQSLLLEPCYRFRIELPADCVGRAMTDVRRMEGETDPPETFGQTAYLTGSAPVSEMRDYAKKLTAYTKGRGRLELAADGWRPCHNAQQVIAEKAYDPEADLRNSPDSVFCAAGAGFTVKWYEVAAYMKRGANAPGAKMPAKKPVFRDEDAELAAIFERTYGAIPKTQMLPVKKQEAPAPEMHSEPGEDYLLIDGYNVIFAWESLSALARESIDSAREALIRMMINFASVRRTTLILVFDAYKVTGGTEKVEREGGIYIVYTRESEIADVFIERAVQKLTDKKRTVRVVTSDGLEQLIVMGRGALRVPASAFEKEVELASDRLREIMKKLETEGKTVLHLWQRMISDS